MGVPLPPPPPPPPPPPRPRSSLPQNPRDTKRRLCATKMHAPTQEYTSTVGHATHLQEPLLPLPSLQSVHAVPPDVQRVVKGVVDSGKKLVQAISRANLFTATDRGERESAQGRDNTDSPRWKSVCITRSTSFSPFASLPAPALSTHFVPVRNGMNCQMVGIELFHLIKELASVGRVPLPEDKEGDEVRVWINDSAAWVDAIGKIEHILLDDGLAQLVIIARAWTRGVWTRADWSSVVAQYRTHGEGAPHSLRTIFATMCLLASKCTSDYEDELYRLADVLYVRRWRPVSIYDERGHFLRLEDRKCIREGIWDCEAALLHVLHAHAGAYFATSSDRLERVIREFKGTCAIDVSEVSVT